MNLPKHPPRTPSTTKLRPLGQEPHRAQIRHACPCNQTALVSWVIQPRIVSGFWRTNEYPLLRRWIATMSMCDPPRDIYEPLSGVCHRISLRVICSLAIPTTRTETKLTGTSNAIIVLPAIYWLHFPILCHIQVHPIVSVLPLLLFVTLQVCMLQSMRLVSWRQRLPAHGVQPAPGKHLHDRRPVESTLLLGLPWTYS